jgi:hypothetical protein
MPVASPILDTAGQETPAPHRLLVAWQHPVTKAYGLVGHLDLPATAGEPYRFTYFPWAGSMPGFRPFVGFPDLQRDYESLELFPFFDNRMTPRSRADYPDLAASVGLDGHADPFEVLARTGGRRATDTIEVLAEPIIDAATGRLEVHFLVHGVSHHRVDDAVAALRPGDRLRVLCDVQNPSDALALALADSETCNLGWVPRYICPLVHRSAARFGWKQVAVEIVHVGDPAGPPHLRLLCRLSTEWQAGDDLWDGLGGGLDANGLPIPEAASIEVAAASV